VARLAVDHNFDARIVAGLLRRDSDLDVMLIRDAGLATAPDPVVLEWAAREGRVLLTHDRSTRVVQRIGPCHALDAGGCGEQSDEGVNVCRRTGSGVESLAVDSIARGTVWRRYDLDYHRQSRREPVWT
jgi:hypothetical protein